jgi:hypothetical protein
MRVRNVPLLLASLSLIHPAHAQTPALPSDWSRVQSLPTQTLVTVKTDDHKFTCAIVAVTADQLTCPQKVFSRTEIKTIKLPRKSKSTLGGLLIGAGIGAGAGAGIGAAINSGDKGSYVHVSGGKSTGIGAAVGAIAGLGIGAIVGHSIDPLASTIYKR